MQVGLWRGMFSVGGICPRTGVRLVCPQETRARPTSGLDASITCRGMNIHNNAQESMGITSVLSTRV